MNHTESTVSTGMAAGVALASVFTGYLLTRSFLKPRLKKTAVKHIFLAKFKDSLTEEEIQEVIAGYRDLVYQIKEMKGFEWGTQITGMGLSSEAKCNGLNYTFVSIFDSKEDVKVFLDHPAHREFAKKMAAAVQTCTIHDFVINVAKHPYYRQ
eukprot:jgi/Mesen1/1987/ME000147S01082